MKRWLVLGLLVLAAIAMIALTTELTTRLFLAKEKIVRIEPLRVEAVPMDFQVDDYVGINADPDALHFGTVPPGNSGQRFIALNNTNTFPVRVTATFKGEAGKYVWTEPERVLGPGEGKEITILLTVPSYLPHGNYTGTAYFTFREARE